MALWSKRGKLWVRDMWFIDMVNIRSYEINLPMDCTIGPMPASAIDTISGRTVVAIFFPPILLLRTSCSVLLHGSHALMAGPG
ncbi:hypothetical protein GDO86_007387 [Hymenochirus boettgeri]|uniref:Uncharacterized protein n=1 Tax=Hymenochirus boettgeri TaxID=247094 RepID=A0A8T2IYS5_9PIPI|nr:hypothetical protein GDO86_007387 [Hymenochirus boettgeri]